MVGAALPSQPHVQCRRAAVDGGRCEKRLTKRSREQKVRALEIPKQSQT